MPNRLPRAAHALVSLAAVMLAAAGCGSGFSIGSPGGTDGRDPPRRADRAPDPADEPAADDAADDASDDASGHARAEASDEASDEASGDAEGDAAREDRPPARTASKGGIDWCRHKLNLGGRSPAVDDDWVKSRPSNPHIASIAHAGCSDRLTAEERRRSLAAFDRLLAWSKLPRAEVSAYLAALSEGEDNPLTRACSKIKIDGPVTGGLASLLGCQGAGDLEFPDDTTTALGSAAVVRRCLGSGDGGEWEVSETLPKFALCGAEGRALDRKEVEDELTYLKVKPVVRTRVRLVLRQIETDLARHDRALAADYEKNPGLRKLLHDIPDQAFATALKVGRQNSRPEHPAFAYLLAFSRRKAQPDCFAPLRDHLVGLVRKSGAKTIEQARKAMVSPAAYSTARALERCTRVDEKRGTYRQAVAAELVVSPDMGSPRSAVLNAVLAGLEELEGPRPFESNALANNRIRSSDAYGEPSHNSDWESVTAVIARASRQSGGVRLEFVTEVIKDQERECRDTDRIHSIGANGTLVYYKTCGPWRPVTYRITEEAVVIPDEGAAGLARGRPVEMYCIGSGAERRCAPLAVWKDKKKKSLVALLGAPL